MFSRYRNIFPKGISKSDKQKWKNALYFFHRHFPSKKIDRILIEEKGVHGYPFVADNSFYKVELQTESTTLFKRKNNILALMQYPLKGVVYPKKITNDDKCIIYEYKHYPDGDLFAEFDKFSKSYIHKYAGDCGKWGGQEMEIVRFKELGGKVFVIGECWIYHLKKRDWSKARKIAGEYGWHINENEWKNA